MGRAEAVYSAAMNTPWTGMWSDPLFRSFALGGQLVSIGAFLAFAAPLTVLAWRDPPALRRYRIQSRRPRAQTLLLPSLGRWLQNNAALSAVVLTLWPWIRPGRVHLGPLPALWVIVAQLFVFAALDDFLFYWMHRALHTKWLFRKVHGIHHRILTPWAVTGHFMHPIEFALTGALALLPATLLGVHVSVLWAWVVWRQWEATEGHSGYDFPYSPSHLFPGSDGARHHDAHHARVKGNYAGFFAYVDGLFGTFARGYVRGKKLE